MSEFKVGARVKVTVEGIIISYPDGSPSFVIAGQWGGGWGNMAQVWPSAPGVTVERLPEPVPTPDYGDVLHHDRAAGGESDTLVYAGHKGWLFACDTTGPTSSTGELLAIGYRWVILHGEVVR